MIVVTVHGVELGMDLTTRIDVWITRGMEEEGEEGTPQAVTAQGAIIQEWKMEGIDALTVTETGDLYKVETATMI